MVQKKKKKNHDSIFIWLNSIGYIDLIVLICDLS
jgi:hypothetical protein